MTKWLLYGSSGDLDKLQDAGMTSEEYDRDYDDWYTGRSGLEIEKRAELLADIQQACALHHPRS